MKDQHKAKIVSLEKALKKREKTNRTVRAKARYTIGSNVQYIYPCGHYRVETLMVGPKGHRTPMEPSMVRRLAFYWRNGVNVPPCPTCERKNT